MVSFLPVDERKTYTDTGNQLVQAGYWPAVAEGYLTEGKYSKAAELCQRMLDLEPNVISGRCILGRALFHAGQYTEARTHLVTALKQDPANLVALKYLGDILHRDGEEAAAMAYYRRIFEIDPRCGGVWCSLASDDSQTTRQVTIKRSGESVLRKKRAPLREPAFITETIGDIYRDQGYYHLAHEVYRRLLDQSNNNRIAEKLRETEERINKKEGHDEASNR